MIPAAEVDAAVREVLSRPEYVEQQPGLVQRGLSLVRDRIAELIAQLATTDGVAVVLQVLLVLVPVLLVLAILWSLRGSTRRAAGVVDADAMSTSPDVLLAQADAAAADGDHALAVRRAYAALVVVLDRSGVLRAVPGTTVGEVDRAAAAGWSALAPQVRSAGEAVSRVVYGDGRAAPAAARDVAATARAALDAGRSVRSGSPA